MSGCEHSWGDAHLHSLNWEDSMGFGGGNPEVEYGQFLLRGLQDKPVKTDGGRGLRRPSGWR